MVAIRIDDTMCCSDFTEWVEEMFEPPVHTIEEISCYTEKFYIFRIDHFYDIAKVFCSIDMSDVDIRYKGDFFSMPVIGEIPYLHRYGSDNRILGVIYTISRESECHYNSDKSYEWYRYVYGEVL
jgi:hypothetical protein